MFRRVFYVYLLSAFACLSVGTANADTVSFGLKNPTVAGDTATFDVTLDFSGGQFDTVEAFQIGVTGSDPLLTGSGLDFSRFGFQLNSATLPSWIDLSPDLLPLTGLGAYGAFDPINGPFIEGPQSDLSIGTLTVDLTGLAGGTDLVVNLAGGLPGFETDAGGTIETAFLPSFAIEASTSVGFDEPNGVTITTESAAVPEPTSLVLWSGLGMMGLIAARRRRTTG